MHGSTSDMAVQVEDDRSPSRSGGDGRGTGDGGEDRARLSARLALGVFIAYLVVAFFVLVFGFGHDMAFVGDDWGLIAGRDLFSVHGLLDSQNGHWSTVPFVVDQVLYRLVGLDSYLPYLTVTVVLHLVLAVLLRVTMRRAGAGPWVATVVAGTFVLFGVGYENMLLSIQVSMVGSMVFGLLQLLLSDHDGPFDRRDALGLVAGLLAIMSSSVGIPMVVAVGVAVLIRRGWKLAAVHTLPLAATYLCWLAWQRSTAAVDPVDSASVTGGSALLQWVTDSTIGVFISLGQHPAVAAGLAILLIAGLAVAWLPLDRSTFRRTASLPLALLVGAVVLVTMIGAQRANLALLFGPELARSSRYMAMGTAMVLPALAVAAAAVIRRWVYTAPFVFALVLIGVPANIRAFDTRNLLYGEASSAAQEAYLAGVAASPLAREVPADTYVDPNELTTANLTTGFLVEANRTGRISPPIEVDQATQDRIAVRLSLSQSLRIDVPPRTASCEQLTGPVVVEPARGEQFVFGGPISVAMQRDDGTSTGPIFYSPTLGGTTLTANVDGRTFTIRPGFGARTFEWCLVE